MARTHAAVRRVDGVLCECWRPCSEKDIDEVLQTHTIFSNVGKGALAKAAELSKAFGTDDEDVVCRKVSGPRRSTEREKGRRHCSARVRAAVSREFPGKGTLPWSSFAAQSKRLDAVAGRQRGCCLPQERLRPSRALGCGVVR